MIDIQSKRGRCCWVKCKSKQEVNKQSWKIQNDLEHRKLKLACEKIVPGGAGAAL